jgi:hypothetical protein
MNTPAEADQLATLLARVDTLESRKVPSDPSERVAAVEKSLTALIVRVSALEKDYDKLDDLVAGWSARFDAIDAALAAPKAAPNTGKIS